MEWGPTLGTGLINGFVLLIVPHASAWEELTAFSRIIMGRALHGWSGIRVNSKPLFLLSARL